MLSPGTAGRDEGEKVDGYFHVPSVRRYLTLSPEDASVVHYTRGAGDAIERRLIVA